MGVAGIGPYLELFSNLETRDRVSLRQPTATMMNTLPLTACLLV